MHLHGFLLFTASIILLSVIPRTLRHASSNRQRQHQQLLPCPEKRRFRRRVFDSSEEKWARSLPNNESDEVEAKRRKRKQNHRNHPIKKHTGKKVTKGKALVSAVASVEDMVLVEEEVKPKPKQKAKRMKKRKLIRRKKPTTSRKANPGKFQPTPRRSNGGSVGPIDGPTPQQTDAGNGNNDGGAAMPPDNVDGNSNGNTPTGNAGGKKKNVAKDVLKMLAKLSIKGVTDSECRWCAVQFAEKAMLGPFAPLAVFISPKTIKRMKFAVNAGKKLLGQKQAIVNTLKKGSQVVKVADNAKNQVAKAADDAKNQAAKAADKAKNAIGNTFKKFKFG